MKAIQAKQKAAARKESAKRTENKTETVTRVRRKSVEMRNLSSSPGKGSSTAASTSIGEGRAHIANIEEGNAEKTFCKFDESKRIDRERERDRERDGEGGKIDLDDDEIDFGSGSDVESGSGSVQYDEGFADDLDDEGNNALSIHKLISPTSTPIHSSSPSVCFSSMPCSLLPLPHSFSLTYTRKRTNPSFLPLSLPFFLIWPANDLTHANLKLTHTHALSLQECGASSAEDRLEKYCVGDILDAAMDPWVKGRPTVLPLILHVCSSTCL